MVSFIISIIGIVITIFFVIGTHEAAHFLAARALNIKVLRFSIGFGKSFFRWYDKSGTEYVLALIPLGGYVKLLDENEGKVPKAELPFAFNRQPYYKKFLVVIAGPLMNIACALVLYWLLFVIGFMTIKPIIGNVAPGSIAAQGGLEANQEIITVDGRESPTWANFVMQLLAHAGNHDQIKIETKALKPAPKSAPAPNLDANLNADKTPLPFIRTHVLDLATWQLEGLSPDPLASIGIVPYPGPVPLIIGKIVEASAASLAALQIGDKIIALNHQPVKDWESLTNSLSKLPDAKILLTIQRNKKTIDVPIVLGHQSNWLLQKSGYLGISPDFQWPEELLRRIQFGPFEAIPHAWQQLYDFTYFNFLLIGKLITGKLSLQSLGGPITIFDSAGTALNYGFLSFISFLAFLSISIGVINLLPIPGLDGGHLLIHTIEFIIRRPVPETILLALYRLGLMLILFVLTIALVNDLLRLK